MNMKAIKIDYYKNKLMDISRDLYIQHDWDMPRGFLNRQARNPKNFTLAQWQQAKRQGKDPRAIKAAIQDSWAISDTQKAFEHALKERGYTLAKGDRRGFVALDQACEVYSIPKWVGLKTKQVKSRLTDQEVLLSVDEAKKQIAQNMTERLETFRKRQNDRAKARQEAIEQKRAELLKIQTEAREKLKSEQETRWALEVKQRQERYNKGLRGLLDRVTGRHNRLKALNERETLQAYHRDQRERDEQVFWQIEERQRLQTRSKLVESFREKRQQSLSQDIEQFKEISRKERDVFDFKSRIKSRVQNQRLDMER